MSVNTNRPEEDNRVETATDLGKVSSMNTEKDRIIGYSPAENIDIPIFEDLSMEDFKKRYPGRIAVVASQLAEDEDFISDTDEEAEN